MGACRPAQRSPTRPMALPSPIRTAKFTNFAPTFKSGGPAGDFFDNSCVWHRVCILTLHLPFTSHAMAPGMVQHVHGWAWWK